MFYICDFRVDPNDSTHKTVEIIEEISDTRAKEIIESFSFLGKLDYLSKLLDISINNGIKLSNFASEKNLKELIFADQKDTGYLITEANGYAMNFSVSSRIFLDRSTNLVKENKLNEVPDLEEFISIQYDNNFAYRFFCKLRNCIVHDRMPFSYVSLKLPDFVELGCLKSILLEYKKWGAVKGEIEELPDIIHIEDYVENFSGSLYAIYLKSVYAFRNDILEAHSIIHNLKKEFQIKKPQILIGNMDTHEITNIFTFHLDLLWKVTEDLSKHPGVNLKSFED